MTALIPLTDAQIKAIADDSNGLITGSTPGVLRLARAIERAHGITEPTTDCRKVCASFGKLNGCSQEIYCESCVRNSWSRKRDWFAAPEVKHD